MLKEIENFNQAFKIIKEAFPVSEYRPFEVAERLYQQGFVKALGYYDEELKGVVFIWEHEDYVFLENFAVAKSARGEGIGSAILQAVSERYKGRTIILEVEKPYDEMSHRRIKFYERNGFILSPFGYMQPVINSEKNDIKLLWMGYQKEFSEDEFKRLSTSIIDYVYNKNTLSN